MQNPPAQEEHQITFLAVGDVKTDTAQLRTTEGERIVIQIVQMAVNISVPEEQISKDDLVELLHVAMRSAGKRTAAGYYNLVSTI